MIKNKFVLKYFENILKLIYKKSGKFIKKCSKTIDFKKKTCYNVIVIK